MKIKFIFLTFLLGTFISSYGQTVPYLPVPTNRVQDLKLEIAKDDMQCFISELTSLSKVDIAKIKISVELVNYADIPPVLYINTTIDGESTKEMLLAVSVINKYLRLRSQGFTRAFTYQSLREQYMDIRH